MAVSQVSMVDARDALLAADRIRFGGANQDLLWNAFARRGLGETAASVGPPTPTRRRASPRRTRRRGDCGSCRSASAGTVAGAQLFVGATRRGPCRSPTPTRPPRSPTGRPGAGYVRVRGAGARLRPRPDRPGRSRRARPDAGGEVAANLASADRGRDGHRRRHQPAAAHRRRRGHQLGLAGRAGRRPAVTVDLAGDVAAGTPGAGQRHAAPGGRRRRRRRHPEPVLRAAAVPGPGVRRDGAGDLRRRGGLPAVYTSRPTRSRLSRRVPGRPS